MSNISSLLSNSYSWLTRQNDTASSADGSATITPLASATAGNPSQNSTSYLLDLSPQAQKYLQGSASSGEEGFTLTEQQQKKLQAILEKYKDVPMDENSYAQLARDLESAGLAPEQLKAQEQINSINPTGMLLDALNGIDNTQAVQDAPAKLQAKADHYLKAILQQWQDMLDASGTASADGSGVTDATA